MLPKDYELLVWLRRGCRRKRVLRFLAQRPHPATPSIIAKELSLHRNKVSETLASLKERNLVELKNAGAAYDRLYRITGTGSRLVVVLGANERVRKL